MKNIFKKIVAYTLILSELFQVTGVYALSKEENVYIKLNEYGEKENITVSEHLYNFSEKTVNDKSKLLNIKNVNGNEKYTQNGNNLVWKTNGNDIYYQGKYEKELPISLSVKYYLNNEEKNIDDMLGKKGNIKIVLTYSNTSYKNVTINGKQEKMYVPYAIVTTSILNNNENKNIKVTNGKIINNGKSSVITAISSPGLYESLKIDDLKDIDKVEITYDTDNFELSSIYSVATTNLFDETNLDMYGQINDLYKSIELLQSNMDTIVNASKKLGDGSNQMDIGITELNNKIQELTKKYQYYRNLDKNYLKEELIKIIEKNINTITPNLEEEITNETSKLIKENKEELEKAVILYTKQNTKTVIDEEVNKIIKNLDVNKLIEKVINNNLYNLLKNDEEIAELTNILKEEINNELKNIINNQIIELSNCVNVNMSEAENEKYINDIAEKYGVTYEQAQGIIGEVQTDTLNHVKKNISDANITEKIINELNDKNYISNLVNTYVEKLNNKINESLNNDSTINEYANELKRKILEAINKDLENENIYLNLDVKEYINSLIDKIIDETASDLSKKYTEEYTNQVVKRIIEKEFSEENVDSKLRELLDMYEDDISKKVVILDDTINTLSNSLNQLNEGSKQMSKGMNALNIGLDKYNKDGINKINELVNGDIKTLQERLEILIELSNENSIIDDKTTKTKSTSKMIFMIDSKSKPIEVISDSKKEEKKKSFLDKIKGLFD